LKTFRRIGKYRFFDSYCISLIYRFLHRFSSADIFLKVPSYRDSFALFVSLYFELKKEVTPISREIPAFPAYFRPVSLQASVCSYKPVIPIDKNNKKSGQL
jgi:hypothetical protein